MTPAISIIGATWRRELAAYFLSPLAYIFIAVFLLAIGTFTFEIGGFLVARQADLSTFFIFHPWLFLLFLPAIAMRLWADDIREGAIELLLTLPAPTWAIVVGKFLAAWTVAATALVLTGPIWASVAWLGEPDHTRIAISYLMSFLMAGAYLAIGGAMSAVAANQVAAFVLAVAIGFVLTAAGTPLVLSGVRGVLGDTAAEAVGAFSLLSHFESAQEGLLDARALLYYASFIAMWLFLTSVWIDARRLR